LPYSALMVRDQYGHDAVLLQSEWDAKVLQRDNANVQFHDIRVSKFDQESASP